MKTTDPDSSLMKLVLLGIFVIGLYLAFFNFDLERAYKYTEEQIQEILM